MPDRPVLTAAYELSKAGVPSTLLEKDNIVGGISRTVHHKGYGFDIGGHRFFTKVKPVEDMWNEVIGDDFLLRKRLSRIYYQKKFFYYPLKPGNALRNLGLLNAAMILLSYLKAQAFPNKTRAKFGRVGDRPIWQTALLHILQDLYRESLGHAVH